MSAKKAHAPIFIVGAGHSGTSLVERTLGRVAGLWSPMRETNWAMDEVGAASAKLEALEALAAVSKQRLVEKSPCHDSRLQLIWVR